MCEGEDTMALTKEEEKALFRFNVSGKRSSKTNPQTRDNLQA
jgi:hypothetical protein